MAREPRPSKRSKQDPPLPREGEANRLELPPGAEGLRFQLARMGAMIREGSQDPIVIEMSRQIVVCALDAAKKAGRNIADNETRDIASLQGIHAWCHSEFVYVGDPLIIEVLQTPARQLRRLQIPELLLRNIWKPIAQSMGVAEARGPEAKMVGDADDAVVLSLALAAAARLEPVRIMVGGDGPQRYHHAWGAVQIAGKWHNIDILNEKFDSEMNPLATFFDVPVDLRSRELK